MQPDNIQQGYKINYPKFKSWASLFEEWFFMINRYCQVFKDDAPYFYDERANTGLISAAAWRCGWLSLEEFQFEKRKKRKKVYGRADLYVYDGKNEY